jgi:hypothetical protein
MGFSSWMTADTKESIYNRYSTKGCKPVFLLQPFGRPSIQEPEYPGYGVFGGVDAIAWLAEMNFGKSTAATIKKARQVVFGYYIETDDVIYVESGETPRNLGAEWFGGSNKPVQFIRSFFNKTITVDGKELTLIDAEKAGLVAMKLPTPKFPLKFSFDKNAVYEDLPASAHCPDQGC